MRKAVLTLLMTFGFMAFLCAQEGKGIERLKDELLKERQEIIQKLKRPQSALVKTAMESRLQKIDFELEELRCALIVTKAMIEFVNDKRNWSGSVSELLNELDYRGTKGLPRSREWIVSTLKQSILPAFKATYSGITVDLGEGPTHPTETPQKKFEEAKRTIQPASPPPSSTSSLQPGLELDVNWRLDAPSWALDGFIIGTVRNNSGRRYSSVYIVFGLYDVEGNLVRSASDSISNLDAEGTWKFKIFFLNDTIKSVKFSEIKAY
ncbi:MAG: hypothetical protein HYR55_11740 [Acidobacteria bacterium]|nr:hypothetical protein [Acidobacteriota bacterium]MBI3657261.1 hypothetical protein [Acidobacteriota bacterium]